MAIKDTTTQARSAAERHRAPRGAVPAHHRHGAWRRDRGLHPGRVALAAGSLPLAVIFALVACMFCAVSIGLLAGELPSAGSLATCAARGLHPSIGFLVASGYVLAAIYIVLNAACIGFFARAARRPNPVLWLVIPVLGIITLVPAWLTSAGIKAFSFVAPLSAPYSYLGPGVAGWMVAGLIYLVYLYRRDRGGWSRSGWCTWTRWRSTSE